MVRRVSVLILIMMSISGLGFGQFDTATIDASIGSNEYGSANNNNYSATGGVTWYLTWDDTYLYVLITGANETEPAILYLDIDPLVPINGGTNTDGTLTGVTHLGNTPNLPFRADASIYVTNTLREFYRSDGSGAWTTVRTGNNGLNPGGTDDYSDGDLTVNNQGNGSGSDDAREFRIAWNEITNGSGRPSEFAWNGYMGATNEIYGEVPSANPDGNSGPGGTPDFIRYMKISNTDDGASTNPMSQDCYTHIGGSIGAFGAINVFDFTLNTTSVTITRGGGGWTIAGQMIIADGTVSFGSVTDTCDVNGNVIIGSDGELILSSQPGGDLTIGGDFDVNGTFNCNDRAVIFDGNGNSNSQTILGSTNPTIDYFLHSNVQGIFLQTDVVVDNEINLAYNGSGGAITLGSSTLSSSDNTSFIISGFDELNYIITDGSGSLEQRNVGTGGGREGFVDCPIGTSSGYAPVRLRNAISGADDFSIRVCEGVYDNGGCSGTALTSPSINHTWQVNYGGTPDFEVELYWHVLDGQYGFDQANSLINYYDSIWNGLGMFSNASDGSSYVTAGYYYHTETYDSGSPPPLSFGVSSGVILPVHWLDVSAVPAGDVARVTWEVEEFNGTAHYWVERSADGINFDRIQKVAVRGQVGGTKTYSIDDHPGDGNHVYRIAVHDWDGSIQYSPLVSVRLTGDPVQIYPNPTTGRITLALNESATEAVNVDVLDAQGRLIAVHQVTDQTLTMELAPGFYFVKIEGGGTQRVVVMD